MVNSLYKENLIPGLSMKEFDFLSRLVYDQCGIKMAPIKKTMLETRLKKRLKALEMNSFSHYCEFISTPRGISEELIHMIDVVTTNKTDFFREPAQFSYLTQKAIPSLYEGMRQDITLKIWSAGCSTGEEPYTLAMVLSEFRDNNPWFNFTIMATDISTKVLEAASAGIYDSDKVIPVPYDMKKKYMLRSKDKSKNLVRMNGFVRNMISFSRLNFMDDDFGIREKLDIIFCRNVIIYFDKITQEQVIKKLFGNLKHGGYLFLGHSETIFTMDIPMEQVAPSTYRKL